MKTLWGLLAIAALGLGARTLTAATITLDAIQDTWITPRDGNANHNNDLLSVRTGSSTTTNGRRYTVLEFDLSSVNGTITGAVLKLHMQAGQSNAGTRTQVANIIPIEADIDEATLTFNIYTSRADLGPADLPFEKLGTFEFTGPVATDTYTSSLAGTSADAAALDARRILPFGRVGILLDGNSGSSGTSHDWTDRETGFAPQLVLEYTPVPEPASWLLAMLGLAALGFKKYRG